MSLMPGVPGRFFEQRRTEVARKESMTVRLHRVSGFLLVEGTGEVAVEVNFPVHFTEMPGMSFGASLDDNQSATEGSYPTADVVVHQWKKAMRGQFGEYWVGARLGVVCSGKTGQKMWVHWHAEGYAMRNPIGTLAGDTVGGTI